MDTQFSLLGALFGKNLTKSEPNFSAQLRNQLAQLVTNASENQDHPFRQTFYALSHQPFTHSSHESFDFEAYTQKIKSVDYSFGVDEIGLLGYISKKSITIYRNPTEIPIVYKNNESDAETSNIYFDGHTNFYPLLDPKKSNLLDDSYFFATLDGTPFFLVYSLDALKSSLDNYRTWLRSFEDCLKPIRDCFELTSQETQSLMNQKGVPELVHLLEAEKRKRMGVFYLCQEPDSSQRNQVLAGLKIFIIKNQRKGGYFNLGFQHENRFQTYQLSAKKHRSLFKEIKRTRDMSRSDDTMNHSLTEYFLANDVVFRLEEAKLTQCSSQKLKLFPAQTNTGLFAQLAKTQVRIEKDFDTAKTVFEKFLDAKGRLTSIFAHLARLSVVFGAEICAHLLTGVVETEVQLRSNELVQHLDKTRDKLVELANSSEHHEAAFFMSRLAVFLDEGCELENRSENPASVALSIAAKYSKISASRSFGSCQSVGNVRFPVVACWLAKCYESGSGVEQDMVQAVTLYEMEKSRGDWTGIATMSIEALKSQVREPKILSSIGSWYASVGSQEARYWLDEAAKGSGSHVGLNFPWGQVYEASNDLEQAMKFYVAALKEDNYKSAALDSIGNLNKSLGSQLPDMDLDVKSLVEIGEAFESRGDHVNSVIWFIRASKLGSERATRTLRLIVGKNEFRDVQYTIGEFFETSNDMKRAMKCYKKMSPTNIDAPDEDVKIPWAWAEETGDIDDGLSREVTNDEFVQEAYLPVEKLKPVSIFYQSSIEYVLTNRRKENFKGVYSGTLNGLELKPNSLGEWKYEDKENELEVRYRGEWQNGIWHGLGDLYETAQNKNSKISVEISRGRFANGRLMAEDGCSDAHITVNKTLNDGVVIEVHIYGQMQETDQTKPLLGFLSKNIFAKHYFFHAETVRTRFRRLLQIHVISSQLGRPDGYEVVGNWTPTSFNLLRNEFNDEKNELVNTLMSEVKNCLFKCELNSRYALLGFYVKIISTETTLEELVNRILTETDERICPKSFRKVANSLSDLIKIRNEVKEYIKSDRDTTTWTQFKNETDAFLRNNYSEWLQEFDKCDPIPSDLGVVSLLLIDPNVLEMLLQVRERIARVWGVNINFELSKYLGQLPGETFVVNFQTAWRNIFKSEDKLRRLSGLGHNKFYPNGWADFEANSEEIKAVCDSYLGFLDELIGVLARERSANSVGKSNQAKAFGFFYEQYSELFTYPLHLDPTSGLLVDYQRQSELLVDQMLHSGVIDANLRTAKHLLASLTLDSSVRISFVLNLLEFVFSVDEMFEKIDETLVIKMFNFLTSLQNKPIEIDRVVSVFVQYLAAYSTTNDKWAIFAPFENIESSLKGIKQVLIYCFDLLLSIAERIEDSTIVVMVCDLLEEQKNLIVNIGFLPMYVPEKTLLSFISKPFRGKTNFVELDEPDKVTQYLECLSGSKKASTSDSDFDPNSDEARDETENSGSKSARHHLYELLNQVLTVLESRIYQFKETSSIHEILTMIERYFDVVGEQIKQLGQQLDANDLDVYVEEKIRLFGHVKSFVHVAELNKYLSALKRYVVVTAAAERILPASQVVPEVARLNERLQKPKLDQLLQKYDKNLADFRARFISGINLSQLVDELKDLESKPGVEDQVVRLVAGVGFLQTVHMSNLANTDGCYIESAFELNPNPLHALECMCLLGLGEKNEPKDTVKRFLSTAAPKLAEIPDERSKSSLVCMLAGVYGLVNLDVTVVCHNEFLVSRDEEDLSASFGSISEQLGNIRFLSLDGLVREQLGPIDSSNESPAKLIEQLVFERAYRPEDDNSRNEMSLRDSLIIFEEVDTLVSTRFDDSIEPTTIITGKELANGVRIVYKAAKQLANRFKLSKKNEEISPLQRFQITVKRNTTMAKFESALRENQSVARFIDLNPIIFSEYSNELWTCAMQVANLFSDHDRNQEKSRRELKQFLDKNDEPLFRLSKDGSSCEYYCKNKWTSNQYASYLNAFFYLELFSHQSQFISPNPNAFGYMKLSCGPVYFTYLIERLTRANLVFGLTSSLTSQNEWILSSGERSILTEHVLKVSDDNILLFPTFVQQSVTFKPDSGENFRILANRDEWIDCICQTCQSLSDSGKTVLVFIRNEADLKFVYKQLSSRRPFLLTNNEISINRFGDRKTSVDEFFDNNDSDLIEWFKSVQRLTTEHCSGQPGRITLLMSEYARGIDFEVNSLVSKAGGLHIVQTWFSYDPKEEIQVKARTSRDCGPTVYFQILNLEELKLEFGNLEKSKKIKNTCTYFELKELSKKLVENMNAKAIGNVKSRREKSNMVLNWFERVRSDRTQRLEKKLNGDESVNTTLIDEFINLPRKKQD